MKRTISLLLLSIVTTGAAFSADKKPNILFIAVDDLRPELGSYGAKHIHSPHMDRLAEQGLLFTQAYTSVPTCGASRASLFTGVRPTPSRFRTYQANAEKETPWAVTMNTHFKRNGYRTLSIGKVFHSSEDNKNGWSQAPWRPKADNYALDENKAARGKKGPSTEMAEVKDTAYKDGLIAAKAISTLQELKKQPDRPFFLAVGFFKPHLPFSAPKKYWDLYPEKNIQLPKNYFLPKNFPKEASYNWGELRNYTDIPKKGKLTDAMARKLIRGYYACVSYTDTQIGKVLKEMDRLELTENTIIILWGDHGWNLGDHTFWCKHTLFESSLHIPLIVRTPGFASGKRTSALTESVDIYPTLCELAGISIPKTAEGKSFLAVLKNPETPGVDNAYSRYGRGDSIRTGRYRYSEYFGKNGELMNTMLYDHQNDPLENNNIAKDPTKASQIKKLSELLRIPRESTRKK